MLFWPLTKASTRSMKRMQELQPQMKALQEKYKDDPRKMNMKLMEFMRENKVSPLGGCLPMLLQIPVFFGFYRMLQSAIELRGARFLWACDLSQPDTILHAPRAEFPGQSAAADHGRDHALAGALDPRLPGMDPVQQKMMKLHAAHVHGLPLQFLGWFNALLDRAKPANHCADEADPEPMTPASGTAGKRTGSPVKAAIRAEGKVRVGSSG